MAYREADPIDGPIGTDLWRRADAVLPGGGVYLTRSADMSGRGVLPGFIAANNGCRVTDVDGREYIDFLGANGPNILGYRHPEVEAAADEMRSRITTATLFPPSLVEVVERLLETWLAMGWGLVAKSGSEVATLGGRVARQHTQRSVLVAFADSYHGNDPELANGPPSGPLTKLTTDVVRIGWNEPQALLDYFATHGDDIAGIILNPLDQRPLITTTAPTADFIAAIEQVRERWGTLVVLDDVRHGFRLHPSGSHKGLGIEPDLIALGKALGNGHSISALLGTERVRAAARKIMFTSTYMFEAPPMAAAIATLDIYERDNVHDHITAVGERLCEGIVRAGTQAGHDITMSGPSTMPTLLFADDPKSLRVRAFSRAAAEEGVILHPFLNWNLSAAHSPDDVDSAIAVAATAFAATPKGATP